MTKLSLTSTHQQNCPFSLRRFTPVSFLCFKMERLRDRTVKRGRITSHLCNLQVLSNYRNVWQYLSICCDQFIIIQSRYFMVTRLIITDWDISADSDPTWSSWASATICYSGLTDWRMWQLHEVGCLSSTIIMIRADKLIIVDTRTSPSITSLIELRSGTSRAR